MNEDSTQKTGYDAGYIAAYEEYNAKLRKLVDKIEKNKKASEDLTATPGDDYSEGYEAGCSKGYLKGYRQGRKDAIIGEPVFIDIMNKIIEYNNCLNKLEECLDGSTVEWMCRIIDTATEALSVAVNDLDGFISWWMWEKDFGSNDELRVYDEDDNELPSKTLSDLYKLVTRQFADEIDYSAMEQKKS